ncbi:MAG TPA: PEPxxWA-CTERM sorting domain-containing protein [Phenylobacterium sp.]
MHLKPFYALLGAAAIAMAATSADAAVTFVGYQTAPNPDEVLVTSFEGGPTLADVAFGLGGYSLSGTGVLFTGSTANVSAAPAFSAVTKDTTQYLSVQQGQNVTLDTPLLSAISFYVGSLDAWNSFTFTLANGATEVVTGMILADLPGMDANGNQTGFTTNGRLTFNFDSDITGVTFASAGDSLEISDIGAVLGVVPEPASWAMMIVGFAGVGALMRRRREMVLA